jgi:hypothetical protein
MCDRQDSRRPHKQKKKKKKNTLFQLGRRVGTRLWRWNRQSVPKRLHLNYIRQGIAQKAYGIRWVVVMTSCNGRQYTDTSSSYCVTHFIQTSYKTAQNPMSRDTRLGKKTSLLNTRLVYLILARTRTHALWKTKHQLIFRCVLPTCNYHSPLHPVSQITDPELVTATNSTL